jgi:hypothetical protein
MKILNKIVAGMMLLGSVNLMADYVAGSVKCDYPDGSDDQTHFIFKGKGANLGSSGQQLAIMAFLNADYASETNRYCKFNKVTADGHVMSFSSKSKANRYYSELINDAKDASYVKKIFTISRGYDESDWR